MTKDAHAVRVLVVDDHASVRELICKAVGAQCEVMSAADGTDALLKCIEDTPDLILSDFRMPGLDGRQLYEKLRGRADTRGIPFVFLASRADIDEKLRPLASGVEDFIAKPFFIADLVRQTKKIIDRLHLEKMQQHASRPGVIQGRLEEMSVTELMQSLEMGQKSCRLELRHDEEICDLYFAAGQCKHAQGGGQEGEAVVYRAISWTDGEFEIDFGGKSDRTTISHSTTGLLMEAMRIMDEAAESKIET